MIYSIKRNRQIPRQIYVKMQEVLGIAMIRPVICALFVVMATPGMGAELLPELRDTIGAIDQVASSRNLEKLTTFFAPTFQTSDGMNLEQLRAGLSALWSRYNQMEYRTTIDRWVQKDQDYIITTTTLIRGLKPKEPGDFTLEAQISSEQTYSRRGNQWQIVSQRILTESSTLRSGEDPPQVELRLPPEIGVGRNYTFDAIVKQPLGNSFVLGATLDEPVNSTNYLKDRSVNLMPLKAGGIFKIGSAPFQPGSRWISAILVQEGGITIVSQRMKVSPNFTGNQYTPLPDLPPSRRLQPKEPRNL